MMKEKYYDFIIIGGGPAGSILANRLQKHYKVLLVDKRRLDINCNKNNKNCGGLIAPDAQKVLATLDLSIPKSVLSEQQMFSVETLDFDNNMVRTYQRHYINVDREKFDRWLVSLSIDNIDTAFGYTYKGVVQTEKGFDVTLTNQIHGNVVSCKYLIGADGANSKVKKLLPSQIHKPKRYVSIQEHFNNTKEINKFIAIFDEEITDFYSWIIPKGNKIIFGSAIPEDMDFNQLHNLQKKKLSDYGFEMVNPTKKEGSYIIRPYSTKELQIGNNNIALIGEAAGFISPTSAEGISYAMKSGDLLGKAILKTGDLSGYEKNIKSLKMSILRRMIKYPAMYNKYLRKLIFKLGIRTIKSAK